MYKRHTGQISMLDNPEFFGSLPLDPNNRWIQLSKQIPWHEFDLKYRENFKSKKGQPACDSRMALASVLLKPAYKGLSDEDITYVIAENPYLQYFLGLHEYRYECPFDPSMMTRFRQRITPEMLAWVNDQIIGRKQAEEKDDDNQNDSDKDDTSPPEAGSDKALAAQVDEKREETVNEGTLILDATCVPQNIRFPTDSSLLNEAREKTEEIIDILHEHGMTEGRKPRTYRKVARKQYNSFSKARKKTGKMIRKAVRQQLGYLKRNLGYIDEIVKKHPDCLKQVLNKYKTQCLEVIRLLFTQQQEMFQKNTHKVENRIVSISQPWVRPIVRGKQNAEVEFGAKVEMSVVNGFLRIESLRWDAFNECTTLQESVESYRKAYGHYPQRVLADTIFRTRENLRYCKEHGIHMNGPKLGKPQQDIAERNRQKKLEWLESGERGEIERQFGTGKRRYTLDCIMMKLKETSEVEIYASVLFMNLQKKLRLLLRSFFSWLKVEIQGWLKVADFALA